MTDVDPTQLVTKIDVGTVPVTDTTGGREFLAIRIHGKRDGVGPVETSRWIIDPDQLPSHLLAVMAVAYQRFPKSMPSLAEFEERLRSFTGDGT